MREPRLAFLRRDAHFPVIGTLKLQGNRAMTKKIKKGQRIGRNPKAGTEVPISSRPVIVFKPSAILKRRINGQSPGSVA
jgi:integration host factor subunit alpha